MGPIIRNLVDYLKVINPLSEKNLIDYLDESSRAWESCILASSKSSVHNQNSFGFMLYDFKEHLSVIASHRQRNTY